MALGSGAVLATGRVVLRADTADLKRGLAGARSDFKGAVGDMEVHSRRLHGTLSSLGKAASLTGAAIGAGGLAAGLISGVRSTVEFDKGMRNVNSIAKLSEVQLKALSKSVLALAGLTAQSPQVLTKGLYDLVSSGFKANDAVKILNVSARAASAGLTDTGTATNAVAAALNAYHLRADSARHVSDVLFETVNKGVLTFEELSQNMGDLVPIAAPIGVSLEEVGAAIATITLQGVPAAEAATRVKNTMVSLAKPSKDLRELLKEQGYASGEAAVKALGFAGVLQLLDKATHGSVSATAKLTPEIRAMLGVVGLTGKNLKIYNDNLEANTQASKGAGAAAAAFAEQSKSVSLQWAKTKATIEAASIQLGTLLLPTMLKVTEAIRHWIERLQANKEAQRQIKDAVHDVTDAIRDGINAIRTIVDWIGGWKTASLLLLGVWTGAKVAAAIQGARSLAVAIGLIGPAAATSAGPKGVGLLFGRMTALKALAAKAIVFTIVYNVLHKAGAIPPLQETTTASGDLLPIYKNGLWVDPVTGEPERDQAYWNRHFKRENPGTKPSTGSNPNASAPSSEQMTGIAKTARSKSGTAYSWGGGSTSGPSYGTQQGANIFGFDCSSFTQYVMAKNGISIPRTTYEQWKTGRPVSGGALQIGDLVFFHMGPRGPEHVGIYLGNDTFIHAPHTGDVIHESKFSGYPNYVGARRYIATGSGGGAAPSPKDESGMPGVAAPGKRGARSGAGSRSGTAATFADPQVKEDKVIAGTIDRFLRAQGSPMEGEGVSFVAAGRKYGIDPRYLVSLAGAESSFGKNCFRPFNPFGWGSVDFGSWREAIFTVAAGLKKGYTSQGRTSVAAIAEKYAPVGASNDPHHTNAQEPQNVATFLRRLGGDPSNIGFATGVGDPYSDPNAGTRARRAAENRAKIFAESSAEAHANQRIYNSLKAGIAALASRLSGLSPEARERMRKALDEVAAGLEEGTNIKALMARIARITGNLTKGLSAQTARVIAGVRKALGITGAEGQFAEYESGTEYYTKQVIGIGPVRVARPIKQTIAGWEKVARSLEDAIRKARRKRQVLITARAKLQRFKHKPAGTRDLIARQTAQINTLKDDIDTMLGQLSQAYSSIDALREVAKETGEDVPAGKRDPLGGVLGEPSTEDPAPGGIPGDPGSVGAADPYGGAGAGSGGGGGGGGGDTGGGSEPVTQGYSQEDVTRIVNEALVRNREATLGYRQKFLSQFAPNIFHREGSGLAWGSQPWNATPTPAPVVINNHFEYPPDDHNAWMARNAFQARSGAMG